MDAEHVIEAILDARDQAEQAIRAIQVGLARSRYLRGWAERKQLIAHLALTSGTWLFDVALAKNQP